ncbi:unnamed protein product [Eruca vesicaria subsp. sativa]|uniref:ADP-ribosylation factor n=1 Tax=Eruca vesicaria subsp. sativa TaxID=29727 RepID=A0ABC8KGA7_ERUVS|nr:unnamed protein product [Eruca vesicaria subsp. sativa]
MGTTFGKAFISLFQEPEPRIMFFGLFFTGKSSILHQLKTGEALSKNMPTIGFECGSVKYKNSSFSFFEIEGRSLYREISIWKRYFEKASGFVYVVDSTDRKGIEEAKSFLYRVMDEMQGNVPDNAPVLVYANKHEVPGAMSASEISYKLDLASLRQRNWQRNW